LSNILEEIESVAQDKFEALDKGTLIKCAVRLMAIELFVRVQEDNEGNTQHVFFSSSDHPLLLRVFDDTKEMDLPDHFMDMITECLGNILKVDEKELKRIIRSILNPNEFVYELMNEEEEEQ
jgi:hypothetical protein